LSFSQGPHLDCQYEFSIAGIMESGSVKMEIEKIINLLGEEVDANYSGLKVYIYILTEVCQK